MRDIIIITVWTIIFSIIMLFTMIYVHNTPRDIRLCQLTTMSGEHAALSTGWEIAIEEECRPSNFYSSRN